MMEITGKLEFGKGLYHSLDYENLIKRIVESRKEYRFNVFNMQKYFDF